MGLLAWLDENRPVIFRLILLRVLVTLLIASATYIYTTAHGFTDSVEEKVGFGLIVLIIIAALTFDEAHRKAKQH